jgi:aminoglycoside phosphotransferase (APT) family kinase protein
VTVTRAAPLAGGASMETWSIDAMVDGTPERLVLRRDMAVNMYAQALSRAEEFHLLEAVYEAGVKVPRPRWLHAKENESDRAFFVMDRVDGESVGRKVVKLPALASARAGLAREMGRQLAKIHAVPLTERLGFLARPPEGLSAGAEALRTTRAIAEGLARHNPVWVLALRWLSQRVPDEGGRPRVLVHGDFRVGNLLVAPTGLAAVIDWEFSHVGDSHEDLAWPTMRDWRFERDALPVGGVGTREDFHAGYAEAGGGAIDPRALAWWEVLGNLRWSVICHAQAERHLSGRDPSVEYASLGRKSAEMEWEILHLLDAHAREKTL